jgi:EAL domain-containing protein (putative c-di-GMP-specific phosphodiesterase class I)
LTESVGGTVNVSAHQLMAAGFAETVGKLVDATSADPGLLTLEVAEGVFVDDEERALVVFQRTQGHGRKADSG